MPLSSTLDIPLAMPHGYYVALFDVLGFEKRLGHLGLKEMLARYEALIDVVHYREEQVKRVFGDFGFEEAPYWLNDGDVFLFTKTQGAYASDSILIWANRTWPDARGMCPEELKTHPSSPEDRWKYQPVPCDNFLDVCNDLMCRGLEVGLPLRGAIAVGDAILDPERHIYLGQPIVDAARFESGQTMISASFCKSAVNQTIPNRFSLQFERHIKDNFRELWGGAMLDWPRHWRNTRKASLNDAIQSLDTDPNFSHYYKNTLELIAHSKQYAGKFESLEETSIRSVYEPFHWSNKSLSVRARAVSHVPVTPNV